MRKQVCFLLLMVLMLGAGFASSPAASQSPDERAFYMGFTPFPYDVDDAALSYTAERLQADGDLIAHHLDEGIPWPEALAGDPLPAPLMAEWEYRRAISAEHQVYLAITPIDISRTWLAPYHGPEGVVPLPAPWDGYTFDHPDVQAAYLNYARRAIDFFQPDYLAIGIEVNGLLTNTPDAWPAYLALHQHVYTQLKADYPGLPVMASLVGTALLEGYTEEADHAAQQQARQDILPYTDIFALSLYPYMSVYTTDIIPDDLFARLHELSDKPIAIAETGYPADTFSLTLPDGVFTFASDAQKQADYMRRLLESAQVYEFRFVVNFVLRDYDAVWEALGRDETLVIWRDTGIYDEDGELRPAGDLWLEWLARPVAGPGED
jgi:hypothetical protein